MSSSDSISRENVCGETGLYGKVQFPDIIDDKINTEEFLRAARDVVQMVGAYTILTSNSRDYEKPES